MTKHADEKATRPTAEVCVLDHARRPVANSNAMYEYDATSLIGLRVIAHHAAVVTGSGEDEAVELPKLDELMAAAAVMRCLMPERLRGHEVRAMRKILRMTLADLANSLDEKTAVETVSRWESEAQPMGGYAEKVLRLFICSKLKDRAPGVNYDAEMIAYLKQVDPWRANPDYELPAIVLELVRVKQPKGFVDDNWSAQAA